MKFPRKFPEDWIKTFRPFRPKTVLAGWRRLLTALWSFFLAGLAVAIPVIATIWAIGFVYQVLLSMSEPLLRGLAAFINAVFFDGMNRLSVDDFAFNIFGKNVNVLGVVILITLLAFVGMMVANVVGRKIFEWAEALVLRIPMVSFIYRTIKDVIEAFKKFGHGGKHNFKRVVYIQYPNEHSLMIGFVTGNFQDPTTGTKLATVFLPMALSPFTGFLYIMDEERLLDCPISMEDAMRAVFSAGLVTPSIPEQGFKLPPGLSKKNDREPASPYHFPNSPFPAPFSPFGAFTPSAFPTSAPAANHPTPMPPSAATAVPAESTPQATSSTTTSVPESTSVIQPPSKKINPVSKPSTRKKDPEPIINIPLLPGPEWYEDDEEESKESKKPTSKWRSFWPWSH